MFLGARVSFKISQTHSFPNICRFCAGGEVFQYIIERKHLTEPESAVIMRQLFSALKYLHDNKISHR